MKFTIALIAAATGAQLLMGAPAAAAPTIGPAPKGDATVVAARIIKANFPSCKRVQNAKRLTNGSIRATCEQADYLVFTVFDAKDNKTIELAMNCTASKKLLDIAC